MVSGWHWDEIANAAAGFFSVLACAVSTRLTSFFVASNFLDANFSLSPLSFFILFNRSAFFCFLSMSSFATATRAATPSKRHSAATSTITGIKASSAIDATISSLLFVV